MDQITWECCVQGAVTKHKLCVGELKKISCDTSNSNLLTKLQLFYSCFAAHCIICYSVKVTVHTLIHT